MYLSDTFTDTEVGINYIGNWLACATCAAFIRQFNSGNDLKAKDNLARRSLEKYRRRYGLHITQIDNTDASVVLLIEIKLLHEKFWKYHHGDPVPYTAKLIEG